LLLSTAGKAGLPVMMQPLSGNASDKKTLAQAPLLFSKILRSLEKTDDFLHVMDSAGYEP
jgi:transposase